MILRYSDRFIVLATLNETCRSISDGTCSRPSPHVSDGWMTMPAVLADGTTIDLLTGKSVVSSEGYSDPLYSRWTKVQERIASASYSDYRLEYARHFCRSRNLHLGPGQLPVSTFEVHYLERLIQPPGEGPPTFRDILIWSHRC